MLSNTVVRLNNSTRFEKERSQGNNDENSNVHSHKSSNKSSSSLLAFGSNKNISSIKGSAPLGDTTITATKRRAFGDISNRKQTANDASVSRADGKKSSLKTKKPFALDKKAKSSLKTNKIGIEGDGSLQKMVLKNKMKQLFPNNEAAAAVPPPRMREEDLVIYDDEETVELSAGRLYGPSSTFFDPTCSFDLDDDDNINYSEWNAIMTSKCQREREQEIQANAERLEKSIDQLYQEDLRDFNNCFHIAEDINMLLEEDEPCLESWGGNARCWNDDDISL